MIERILHDQLMTYFRENKLLYGSQYGFRTGHSTELATAELIDRVMHSLDSRDSHISIFADISKAFDCIDHAILLSKLAHYGLEGKSVALFSSYLSDRYQFVKINNVASDSTLIDIGVPQGSILGPLLFTIYINDIAQTSHILQSILYADDSTFSLEIENPSKQSEPSAYETQAQNVVNEELEKISVWLKSNRLCINIKKRNT